MRLFAVVFLALLAMAASAGCGSETGGVAAPPETTTEPTPTTSNREAAPPLSGVTLESDAIALADLRGRPVLINIWSSW
jgi:hypothetical protein